jgi:hypothetical protein
MYETDGNIMIYVWPCGWIHGGFLFSESLMVIILWTPVFNAFLNLRIGHVTRVTTAIEKAIELGRQEKAELE